MVDGGAGGVELAETELGGGAVELPEHAVADEPAGGRAGVRLLQGIDGLVGEAEVEQAGAAVPGEGVGVEHGQPRGIVGGRGVAGEVVCGVVEQVQAGAGLA